MKYTITYNELTVNEWLMLRDLVGFPEFDYEVAENALLNSSLVIGIRESQGKHIAMMRVIGDNAYAFYLNDVIVSPHYQGMGLAKTLLEAAIQYIQKHYCGNHMFSLSVFSNENATGFYYNVGFLKSNEIPLKVYIKCNTKGTRKECLQQEYNYEENDC